MYLLKEYQREQRHRNLRPESIRRRSDDLRSFARFLGDTDLMDATHVHVEAWLATRGKAPRTRYNLISSVSCFYQWAMRVELADHDPTARVTRPRLRRYLPRPILDADLAYAIRVAPPKMRAWLSLMAYSGLRCQEVAGVHAADLLWHLDPPMLLVSQAKGGNERTVPLSSDAEAALRAYGVPRHGPVFVRPSGRPFSPAYVSRETSVYLANLGIDATAHQLRHWFATKVYVATLDIRATQELLGHASPTTTAIYTAFAASSATGVVRTLSVN